MRDRIGEVTVCTCYCPHGVNEMIHVTHTMCFKQRQAQGEPLVYVSCQQYFRKGFGVTFVSFLKKFFWIIPVHQPLGVGGRRAVQDWELMYTHG